MKDLNDEDADESTGNTGSGTHQEHARRSLYQDHVVLALCRIVERYVDHHPQEFWCTDMTVQGNTHRVVSLAARRKPRKQP